MLRSDDKLQTIHYCSSICRRHRVRTNFRPNYTLLGMQNTYRQRDGLVRLKSEAGRLDKRATKACRQSPGQLQLLSTFSRFSSPPFLHQISTRVERPVGIYRRGKQRVSPPVMATTFPWCHHRHYLELTSSFRVCCITYKLRHQCYVAGSVVHYVEFSA